MIKKIKYFFIIISIGFLLSAPLFVKVYPECRSQDGRCPEEIETLLKPLAGKNLVIAKKNASKILKENFLVGDFNIQFKLPNKIQINMIAKKPIYAILDKISGKYFLIDESGLVLAEAKSVNLPLIAKDAPEMKIGSMVTAEDLFALKLVQGINIMYQISTGARVNDTLLVDLPQGIRVIFPLRGSEVDVLLGSLRIIYTKVSTEYSGKFSQIDLRYKNPILR